MITLALLAFVACEPAPADDPALGAESAALHSPSPRALRIALLRQLFAACPDVPTPGPGGWGASDEAGNTNTQGPGTACRAAMVQAAFAQGGALYRLDQRYGNSSPQSPFGQPLVVTPSPTFCLEPPVLFPYPARFCGHSEGLAGDWGAQGTQVDFFGHAGLRPDPSDPPSATVFYNGFAADDVQAGALGADQVKPLKTIGILLDATRLNGGNPLGPRDVVTKQHVWQMLVEQDLAWLGFRPGMAVFIYTGKGDTWETDPGYYYSGPGLSVDVVTDIYVPNHIVLHGLDNPFTDQADLRSPNPADWVFLSGNDPENPFPVHAATLTSGLLMGQNFNLGELAANRVWLFAFDMAAPQIVGAKGAMVSPTAYGGRW